MHAVPCFRFNVSARIEDAVNLMRHKKRRKTMRKSERTKMKGAGKKGQHYLNEK